MRKKYLYDNNYNENIFNKNLKSNYYVRVKK